MGIRHDGGVAATQRVPPPRLVTLGRRDRSLHRLPRRRTRLLRRPRGRQHQGVLGEAQGRLRRVREGADGRAVRRAGAGVRRRRRSSGPTATCGSRRTRRRTRPTRARSSGSARRPAGTSRSHRAAYAPAPASTRRTAAGSRRSATAVAHDRFGPQLEKILRALEKRGFEVGGDRLKTTPRGYDADHPRIELLRHRSLTVGHQLGFEPVIHTPELLDLVRADWQQLRPLVEWVAEHVRT